MAGNRDPEDLANIPNPWIWSSPDYQENIIRITVNWDPNDGDILGGVVYKHPDCVFNKIYIGLSDANGTVNDTPDQWSVPDGETNVPRNVIRKARLRNIVDVVRMQITAGP